MFEHFWAFFECFSTYVLPQCYLRQWYNSTLIKGLAANAADRDTDGDVEAEAKGEAEAEDQQVLIATLDLQGGMLSIFLKHILKCISNDSR